MQSQIINKIPILRSLESHITSGPAAMDVIAPLRYEMGASAVVAGEVLQKFVNYKMRLAIVGDFSHYTSKPLRDFICESNKGSQVGFWPTEEEALAWLNR